MSLDGLDFFLLGVPPFVLQVIHPPKMLVPLAPLSVRLLVRHPSVPLHRVFLPGGQVPCFENDQELPVEVAKKSKQGAIGIEAVGENDQR